MISHFFIDRPIFASVLSIVFVLAGGVAVFTLPVAQYPDVTVDLHLGDNFVDLVGEGYDAAIRIASLPDSSLITRTLAPVSRHLVASPRYLSKHGHAFCPLKVAFLGTLLPFSGARQIAIACWSAFYVGESL